ncbi:MAG: DUF5703 domain-containing protein [Acidobacteriaceae bacterium]|nr:DUF5703 domain-containing protein [Acidobacteriaceae bacterium]
MKTPIKKAFHSSFAGLLLAGFALAALTGSCVRAATLPDPSLNNVAWQTLGTNENDSMPIGNGDLAANVWTEQNGDIVLLIAKSDALTELGKLVKLARVRIHLSDNPFAGASDFTQTLRLENASVELKSGASHLTVWVDANRPVLHVSGDLARPSQVEAKLEIWRTRTHSFNEPSPDRGGLSGLVGSRPPYREIPVPFTADTVVPATADRLTWYHFNSDSIYPESFKQQHLEEIEKNHPDPLLHHCFGATLEGAGLKAKDDRTLVSAQPQKEVRIALTALTTTAPVSAQAWQQKLDGLVRTYRAVPFEQAWSEHTAWWTNFWRRSWIQLSGSEEARKVSQGYIMQRYMMAASSRGAFPAKLTGSLFTVGRDLPDGVDSTDELHNPDYRKWGSAFWNQNQRHFYWPLLATGDFDLVKPWFDMYVHALPMAKDRVRAYYHHDGAEFIETINFWGLPTLWDFDWDNKGNETNVIKNTFIRHHIQGGLEVSAQMLDQYDITQDAAFAREQLVPFADAVLTFYAQHWKTDESGKLRFYPMNSLETYQVDVTNPTPDIAGILNVAQRLLELPASLTTSQQRAAWKQLLDKLPPLPMGTTHDGKQPPMGHGDADGTRIILPAQVYGGRENHENPELYAVFPYRIYGVGKPDLELARNTFAARAEAMNVCWGQDGEEAALLGLTEEARKDVVSEMTHYGDQRFKWFWDKHYDWIPDMDNGGAGMVTLQSMLMQTDGRRILLTPAWPKDWTADFKLHAPFNTTVEGRVEGGKVTGLKVTPESRRADVTILNQPE